MEKAKVRQLATLKQFSKKDETLEMSQSTDSLLVGYREEELEQFHDAKGKTLEIVAQKAGAKSFTPITLGVISTEVMARL